MRIRLLYELRSSPYGQSSDDVKFYRDFALDFVPMVGMEITANGGHFTAQIQELSWNDDLMIMEAFCGCHRAKSMIDEIEELLGEGWFLKGN